MRAYLLSVAVLLLLCFGSTVWGQTPPSLEVTARAANLRSGPGTNYTTITAVDRGVVLTVIDQVGVWYLINLPPELGLDSKTAYVHRSTVTPLAAIQRAENPVPVQEPSSDLLRRPEDPFEDTTSEELDTYELQRTWSESQWREYSRFEKNTFAAAGLEWLIPTLGHGYVDRASRGLTPALVSVGGLTLAIIGTQVGCSEELFGECISEGSTALVWTGLLGYVGGRIWGIVSALDYAEEYNREVAKRISRR